MPVKNSTQFVTVAELANALQTSKTSIYLRIREKVIKVSHLKGVKKYLNAAHSRIRYLAAEKARAQEAYSLSQIAKLLDRVDADAMTDAALKSGEKEQSVVDHLVSKILAL